MPAHRHVPTPEQRRMVEAMAGYGIPQEDIARVLGVNRETLAKWYDEELKNGVVKANSKIAETMYNQAIGGDRTLLIWWSKARMGWHETVVNQHGGINGGAIKIALSHADNEL